MDIEEIRIKMLLDPNLLWYNTILFNLRIELGESPLGTAHTDGIKIIIDPKFWEKLSEKEKIGLVMHELRHITDMHKQRRAGREPRCWNIACDFVINVDIKTSGYELPQGGLYDPQYAEMAAEEVYEALIEKMEDNPKNYTLTMEDIGEDGTEEDMEDVCIQDVIVQATQAVQMQERKLGYGSVPFEIQRIVNVWLNPVLPWDVVFRRFFSARSKEEFTYKRRNRRYAYMDIAMPGRWSENLGDINVYIDSSCSVSDDMFDMQVGQMKWIHRNLRPTSMNLITFNTRIIKEWNFKPHEEIKVSFNGRGGTHVREVVEHMEKSQAEVNIIFTDGYFTLIPLDKVKSTVLCCIYDNSNFEWEGAETIYIPKE